MNVDDPSHGMMLSNPLCLVEASEVAFFLPAISLYQLPWFFGSSHCQREALARRRYIHLHPEYIVTINAGGRALQNVISNRLGGFSVTVSMSSLFIYFSLLVGWGWSGFGSQGWQLQLAADLCAPRGLSQSILFDSSHQRLQKK